MISMENSSCHLAIQLSAYKLSNYLILGANGTTSDTLQWGARYLMGENLEVVWAGFSTLSLAVLFQSNITALGANSHL
jgi:hypothetical protein